MCANDLLHFGSPYHNIYIYICSVHKAPHPLSISSTCSQYSTKYEPPSYNVTFPYFLLLKSHICLCNNNYL